MALTQAEQLELNELRAEKAVFLGEQEKSFIQEAGEAATSMNEAWLVIPVVLFLIYAVVSDTKWGQKRNVEGIVEGIVGNFWNGLTWVFGPLFKIIRWCLKIILWCLGIAALIYIIGGIIGLCLRLLDIGWNHLIPN